MLSPPVPEASVRCSKLICHRHTGDIHPRMVTIITSIVIIIAIVVSLVIIIVIMIMTLTRDILPHMVNIIIIRL